MQLVSCFEFLAGRRAVRFRLEAAEVAALAAKGWLASLIRTDTWLQVLVCVCERETQPEMEVGMETEAETEKDTVREKERGRGSGREGGRRGRDGAREGRGVSE